MILDAKTGFAITVKGRKDLKDDVKGVYESWDKFAKESGETLADLTKHITEDIESVR